MADYEADLWTFNLLPLSCGSERILQINSSNDGAFLWVLSEKLGYLYRAENGEFEEASTFESKLHRSYGNSHEQYYEFDPETCQGTIYPDNERVEDACQAVFTSEDKPIYLYKGEGRTIKLIRWDPTVI